MKTKFVLFIVFICAIIIPTFYFWYDRTVNDLQYRFPGFNLPSNCKHIRGTDYLVDDRGDTLKIVEERMFYLQVQKKSQLRELRKRLSK